MAGTNQFYPVATGSGANALDPATWATSPLRQSGFQSGIAPSSGFNTAWRQGTTIASMIGAFIASQNYAALDNGDLGTLLSNYQAALNTFIASALPPQTTYPNSSLIHFGIDSSGTPGQIVASITPSTSGYAIGYSYTVVANNNAIGGGTTANLGNNGTRTVVRADGSPIQGGDYVTGEVITLIDDGSRLQLSGILTANIPASNIAIFTSTGNFTVPAGVTKIKRIRIWGAGGGGGGSTGNASSGSGAGGGGYSELPSFQVTPGSSLTITVGNPGNGGSSANGGGGGTSSIAIQNQSAFAAATGGGGGLYGNNTYAIGAGSGGTGAGNGLNVTGGTGCNGLIVGTVYGSGIGGAGAFGGGTPTPNWGVGATTGNFPGGGGNGGCGGSNGAAGAGGLVVFEY